MESPRENFEPDDSLPEVAKEDHFAPPAEPCLCFCLNCQRQFTSDRMWFMTVTKNGKVVSGFWMCPTNNCGGKGFEFDIFPVDPSHPANAGWTHDDDSYDGEEDDDEVEDDEDETFDPDSESSQGWEIPDDPGLAAPVKPADEEKPYDPAEPDFSDTDAWPDGDEDDLEGEEWKHGLAPGERPPLPPDIDEGLQERLEEEKRFDLPDQRPRSIESDGDP